MPGPITPDNTVYLVDIPQWGIIEAAKISELLGIPNVTMINDAVANGYGVLNIPDEE
jgi:glucokinase